MWVCHFACVIDDDNSIWITQSTFREIENVQDDNPLKAGEVVAKPRKPDTDPTAVILVDLIQMLMRPPLGENSLRVAVVVSAWDLVVKQQRSGAIVNTGSESGLGSMGQANYAAAKEGIIGFTKSVARDLGRYGCRCNAIRPRAATRLTLSDELRQAAERARAQGLPAPDLGPIESWTVDGVAPLVVWLCSDAASSVNGRNFIVSARQITLMTEPTWQATLYSEGGWSLDQLDAELPQSVTSRLRNEWPAKEKKD